MGKENHSIEHFCVTRNKNEPKLIYDVQRTKSVDGYKVHCGSRYYSSKGILRQESIADIFARVVTFCNAKFLSCEISVLQNSSGLKCCVKVERLEIVNHVPVSFQEKKVSIFGGSLGQLQKVVCKCIENFDRVLCHRSTSLSTNYIDKTAAYILYMIDSIM